MGQKIHLITEHLFPPHSSILVHPSRSITHQCHLSLYIFRAVGPFTSHISVILTSTLGYYLEIVFLSFF